MSEFLKNKLIRSLRNSKISGIRHLKRTSLLLTLSCILFFNETKAANEVFQPGAFIINMGVVPQTVSNGLKPYGLIYALLKNNGVPIKWVIGQGKVKDGIDFTYNSIAYRGGTFIIAAEYRSAAVNAVITAWQAKGVVGVTTTTAFTIDVTQTLSVAPYWAMDASNGAIAIKFLVAAEIPATAYYYRTPATLTCCDDLYVMPHADPKWSTHSNLFFWNLNCRGGIWAGCHAVSVMEGPACVNPSNASQNLKFLTTNGMVPFGSHNDGTPPYSYLNYSDPVFQMMGAEDGAHSNGSERIYMPLKTTSAWRPSVKIGCYDPTLADIPPKSDGPGVLTAYGRGFNDPNRGFVMVQAGHDIGGTTSDQVSAQREFFNWSFLVSTDKSPTVTYTNVPTPMTSLVQYNTLTATPVSPTGYTTFTYQWFSSIGGTFSAPTSNITNFTPPAVGSITYAVIYCKVFDGCGRSVVKPVNVTILPAPVAPNALSDTISYATLCDGLPKTINVLVNDWDLNGNMGSTITFIGGGNYGTFTNNGNGSVTYAPGSGFAGTDTMRYQICDLTNPVPLCSQATIRVITGGSGICPLGQYQRRDSTNATSVFMQNGIANQNEILGWRNEFDGDHDSTAKWSSDNDSIIVQLGTTMIAGDTIYIRAGSDNGSCVDWTAMGSLTSGGFIEGVNTMNFQAPAGANKIFANYYFIPTQSTRYVKIRIRNTPCDNKLDVDALTGFYRVCVTAIPTANGDVATTGKNTSVIKNVKSNDTDPQNLPLTVTIVSYATNGTATVNGAGNIIYTPNSGYTGIDQLIYESCNSWCLCDTAKLTITVTGNPCPGGKIGTYHSGNGSSVFAWLNVATPTEILGVQNETNGNSGNSAKIANSVGSYITVDLGDTVTAGNSIIIRMSSDNNSAVTAQVDGDMDNLIGSPSTTTNFNLPAGQNKIYQDYNFVVTDSTRYVKISQIGVAATIDIDAISFGFWLCSDPPNRAPQAVDDTISTYANRPATRNVKANDFDPDGNPLTISIITQGLHGTGVVSGGNITYTPNFGYIGQDTIIYKVCDSGGPSLCDTALYIISNIYPGPPVGMNDTVSTLSGNPVVITVQSNDTLSVSSYTYSSSLLPALLSPSNGFASMIGNSVQYTPNFGFTGIDSLAYQICDNGIPVSCDPAIVYINVTNRSPVAFDDTITTSACNSVIINVKSNDTDPEAGVLTISSVSVPSNGTAVISNNQIVYTPSSSPVFTGVATFTYIVCDNGVTSRCDTGNVSVTVNANNPPSNPPNAVNDHDTTYMGQAIFVPVLANDSDPDSDSLRVDSTAVGLLAPSKGTIQYQPGGQIKYMPNPGTFGLDSFQYKVCDIHNSGAGCVNILSSCSIAKVYLAVYNRRPNTNDDSISTVITFPINNTVASNDYEPDGQPMTWSIITGPVTGTFSMDALGNYTYTPNGVYVGKEYITYRACDDQSPALCDTALLTIEITTTNVPPNPQPDTVYAYGRTPATGNVSTNDYDPNGVFNPNSYVVVPGPINGSYIFNANGTFTYTADTGFVGTDYLFYSVCDTGAPIYCNQSFLTIIVLNMPPVTINESYSVNEDNALVKNAATGILANGDYDPNGNGVHVDTAIVTNPVHGIVSALSSNGSFTYTPNAGFNGSDKFIVNVCDSTDGLPSLCTHDTIFITVLPVNDAPTVVNDTKTTNEDTPVGGTVITAGDFDPDSTTMSANTTPVSGPSHGGIVINANGTYTYTPALNFNGIDIVVISVCDNGNPLPAICKNDTLTITVLPINDIPTIVNDTKTTNEDTPVGGTVLTAGDVDPDTTLLSANTTPVSGPSHGGIVVNANGTYTYTPAAGFNGTDVVVISICDAGTPMPSLCKNDTLVITVLPLNDAPTIVNDTKTTNEDTPVGGTVITAGDVDPDSTILSANTTPVSGPSHGGIVINANGTYTYTPALNFNGTDVVVISICDAGTPMPSLCVNDTLVITVLPLNDPPVTTNENNSTNEDTPVGGTVITGADVDPDSTLLSANTTPVRNPAHGGIVVNANGTYTYTPALNFNGKDTVVISICDAGTPMPSLCTNDTLVITVLPLNDAPTIVNDIKTTNEDTPVAGTVLTAGDIDPDSTILSANVIPVSGPSHGGIVINANGTYTYTPALNFNGTDVVVISICDAGTPMPSQCVNDTLVITILPVNDPPVTTNESNSTNEDIPIASTVITGADVDPDSTLLSANTTPVRNPANGNIFVNANGTYIYVPNLNFNGTDTVVISICDAGTPLPSLCTNDTLVITVNAVNDPPVITRDTASTLEGTPTSGTILTGTDIDPDSTTLVVDTIPISGPTNGTFTIDTAGNYTYTPDSLFNGKDTVIIRVCDQGTPLPAICVNDTLIFTIGAVNDPPVTVNDVNSTNEDIPVGGNVITGGDLDPDSTMLSANTTPVVAPSYGNIVINANGSYTYTPNLNFNGTEVIVISICDSGTPLPSLCTNDTLVITVLAVNDPPVISADSATTSEGTPVSGTILNGDDIDPDSTALVVDTILVAGPSHGTYVIDTAGNYTYTPDSLFNGVDTVIISICDGGNPIPSVCTNDTLIFTVTAVNDPPFIVNDVNTTNEDIPVVGNVITGADADPDSTMLWANTTPVLAPSYGNIVINANGSYTYTPNLNFNGTDVMVISICDNGTPLPSLCTNDTLVITVLPVNDPPVTSGDTASTSEATPTSGTILTGTDIDPDSTSLTVDTIPVSGPLHGTFTIDSLGNYTYTPDSLFNGVDTVIISICDGGTPLPALCTNDTLIFTITAVNDPPFTVNDVDTTNEDTPVFGTVITGADADPDSTMLSANTTPVLAPSYGNIVINANGTYTYTPNLNFNGTDVMVISICDAGTPLPSLCTNDTLVITVIPVNDPPVISSDTGTTSEGTPTSGIILTGTDFDPDTTSLIVDTVPVKPPSNGTFVIDSLGNYTYTPDSLFNGTDTVIISICDGGIPLPGLCENDTLIFTVTSVNDAPFIVNDVDTTNEDITQIGNVITVADADPEGTLLSANTTPVYGPLHGNIVINANGSYSYTPNLNFNGTDTVVISICDSGTPLPALCVNDTLIFTINAVNDPPVITGDTITTQEDAPATGSVINANDIDPDTTVLVADTVPVFGPLHGTFSIDTAGNYTYTPNADFNGTDTIVISLCDGGTPLPALCVYDTLIITIQRVNDAPIAFNDSVEVCSGNSVIIYPLPNDFDIDGDTLIISSINLPVHGTVLTTNKTLTYTPDPFYLGMDSITYTVCDSTPSPLCTTGVIYIDVHGIFSTGMFATEVLCYGESTGSVSATPIGAGPFTYQWTDSGTFVSNSQNVNSLPYGMYTVAITDSLGCSRSDSILVDQPAAPISMSSTQTDVKCFGDSTGDITLTINGGSFFYSYVWSNGDVSQSVTQLLAGTYTVVATDSHGCSDSLTTTITQPAAAISISGITSIANCLAGIQGSVDATIAGGTPGYTYSWSNGDLTQDISDLGGNYLLTVTDSNSCVDTMSFTIGDTSVFTASTIDSTTFCAGDSAKLNASVTIGTFQWYESGNPIIGANNSSYNATLAGQYNVSVNNSCGNYSSNNITITIATQPSLSITGIFDICDSSSTQLTATGANNYQWTPPVWIDDDTIANPTVSPSLTMNYNVRGYIGSCYSDSQVTITVHPLPNVTVSSSAYHCTNGSQLIATGGINYVWSPLTGLDFANIATPVATPGVTTSYTVVVSDINNCTSTRALILVVDCDSLIIPTGISPDNDGDNDIWQIQGLTKYPGNGVSIFSRWGNLVYQSQPYNNDWNGNCSTHGRLMGESLPEGTYYYILELGEGFPSKAGFVEIRRK